MPRKRFPRSIPLESQQGAVRRAAAASLGQINPPEIKDLAICIEDVRQAGLDGDGGPGDPTDFSLLRGRLESARSKFPPLYRQDFLSSRTSMPWTSSVPRNSVAS